MIDVPENELFSAYLDGELTAAEQAEVEQLLSRSPAARQLMEELRALSSTLQSLPAHKLDEDLGPQVLRLAEQRVLSGRSDPEPFSEEPAAWTGRLRALGRRLRQPRIWFWPAMAAAVAILLAIFLPEHAGEPGRHLGEKRLAMAPPAAPHASLEQPAGKAAPAGRRERGEERRLERMVEGERGGEKSDAESAPASRSTAAPAARPTPPAAVAGAVKMKALAGTNPKAAEQTVIIRCEVTREALRQRVVEQVLQKRQVALTQKPAKDRGSADKRTDESLGKIVYLHAELTPAQFSAVVGDLQSRPDMIRSVSSTSPAAGGQTGEGYGGAGRAAETFERLQSGVLDQAAMSKAARGARGVSRRQAVQGPAGLVNSAEQQIRQAGQASHAFGKSKSPASVPAEAPAQEPARYQALFVLHAVDPRSMGEEKAGKAKAALATPSKAEAAKATEPSKPAAAPK